MSDLKLRLKNARVFLIGLENGMGITPGENDLAKAIGALAFFSLNFRSDIPRSSAHFFKVWRNSVALRDFPVPDPDKKKYGGATLFPSSFLLCAFK